ncbi:MAG: hypothetical protein MRZ79_14240 [Bacteroidia bacterium]|nr:hypothetical protein [Bacteroidia bacterium]
MDKIALKYKRWTYLIPALVLFLSLFINCSRKAGNYASLDSSNSYVGTQACQSCHKKITESYLQTGMGKSMYRPSKDNVIESFGAHDIVYDSALNFYYAAQWKGEDFFVREFRIENADTLHDRWEKIDYVVGSGHQTRSYLLERDGYIYEAPITWYVNKKVWDLSPGYDINNSRFDREIGLTCMACHTGHVDYVEESKNRYRYISEGIDCEKCHGPGATHIEKINAGQMIDVGMEIDYTIVNPAKLPIQKQFDICQQCHLQGTNVLKDGKFMADFRPGMLLNDLGDVFVEKDPDQNAFGIASHAQRLQMADCFTQSNGELTCTSCHDPHKSISVTEEDVYIKQCQSCHQAGKEKLCAENETLLLEMKGNCISCHMPSGGTSDIPHVSFHDHFIRVVQRGDSLSSGEVKGIIQLVCATDSQVSSEGLAKAWLDYFETQNRATHFEKEVESRLNQLSNYDQARFYFLKSEKDPRFLSKAKQKLDLIPEEELTPLSSFLDAEIAEAEGNFASAHKIYLNLYKQNGERWDAGLKAGTNLLKARPGDAGVLAEAEALFMELQQKKSFDLRVKNNLAFISLNRRDFRKTERLLVSILKKDPDNQTALRNMAFLQGILGNGLQQKLYQERLQKADLN